MAEDGTTTEPPQKRRALYYPYIHIRDENWLKGTILGFQQVRRIVPVGFATKDAIVTEPYSRLKGPAGPLLAPAPVDYPQMAETQQWLRKKIGDHLPELRIRYSREETYRTIPDDPHAFQMHAMKLIDPDFVRLLKQEHLAWHARDPNDPDAFNWLTMHPKFGSAIMSVLAIAIARAAGLSVVTPSGRAHHDLLARREEDVFEKLLDIAHPAAAESIPGVTVEELAHVVITTGFDLTKLTPEDIAELLNEGKDLRSFRETVAKYTATIPVGVQGEERVQRLKEEAESVLEEWRKYTGALPQFAKDAIIDAVLDKAPDKLLEAGLAGVAAGAIATSVVGAVPGLAITIVVASSVKMFRKRDTPLRFLSKVNNISGKRIGSIYVPSWRALAAQAA